MKVVVQVAIQAGGIPDGNFSQWGVEDGYLHELRLELSYDGSTGPNQRKGFNGSISVRYCFNADACGCGVKIDGGDGLTIGGKK